MESGNHLALEELLRLPPSLAGAEETGAGLTPIHAAAESRAEGALECASLLLKHRAASVAAALGEDHSLCAPQPRHHLAPQPRGHARPRALRPTARRLLAAGAWCALAAAAGASASAAAGASAAAAGAAAARAADGCRHVYVDLGTNVGHQINKVYRPHLYKNGTQHNPSKSPTVEPIFAAHFGADRDSVCSFGFEANPAHTARLRALEAALRSAGHRVTVFTETAVSVADGEVDFFRDPNTAKELHEWGAGLTTRNVIHPQNVTAIKVPCVDFSSWFLRNVVGRTLAAGTAPPAVVVKMDIEGHDEAVLSKVILDGGLCAISELYGEHISEGFAGAVGTLVGAAGKGRCSNVTLTSLDDESGADSALPPVTR